MFGKRREEVKAMDQVRNAESSEVRLTDITESTLVWQISIWRMGKVTEAFYCKSPLIKIQLIWAGDYLTPLLNVLVTLNIRQSSEWSRETKHLCGVKCMMCDYMKSADLGHRISKRMRGGGGRLIALGRGTMLCFGMWSSLRFKALNVFISSEYSVFLLPLHLSKWG